MESIRTSMVEEAESLKKMVDEVVSENMEKVNKIELSLLEKTPSKQLQSNIHLKPKVKQTLSLSVATVIKVREFQVTGAGRTLHISPQQSGKLWVSDLFTLVQTDLQGNCLQKIETSGGREGYHSVTQDGDLIFTNKEKNVIKRIAQDNKITEFFTTEDWTPLSIHSSKINGDILVGMQRNEDEVKITRYNKEGKEIQQIQKDSHSKGMYSSLCYITENINGDICTSDILKHAVIVVNKSGQYRFSYTGQKPVYQPYGICTDVLGHILVCDVHSNAVHLLDQDGQFISVLLSKQQGVHLPCSVCIDDENNLYVGEKITNNVKVFTYLK
ncbi:uncharacterized protein LOC134251527 [Saccostrea cucullata]|uniref:uncharacterized protein LOC134251527 n=1 Tax=Saccostrea cuccullata TaxID=36930 RepID=UPI002ED2031E